MAGFLEFLSIVKAVVLSWEVLVIVAALLIVSAILRSIALGGHLKPRRPFRFPFRIPGIGQAPAPAPKPQKEAQAPKKEEPKVRKGKRRAEPAHQEEEAGLEEESYPLEES